jgi:23S rRNA pseudouridine2605 synthase/23S rRNA pseudouridine2604 synthase
MPPEVRIQKYIAECGVASRRNAEKLILSGMVKLNGKTVTQLGVKVDPAEDKVVVDGKTLKQKEPKIYIKVNKPRGYVSSCRKFKDEKTILDVVKNIPYRLYPIGRLDKDSEGLMILTNDGELANRLMHPRYAHEKEYVVKVMFKITQDKLTQLSKGIMIEGKKTLPAKVHRLGEKQFRIVLREGRKRQIKMMVEKMRNRVVALQRTRIRNVRLDDLPAGGFSHLTPSEIKGLML